jgi:hypothetical protein
MTWHDLTVPLGVPFSAAHPLLHFAKRLEVVSK